MSSFAMQLMHLSEEKPSSLKTLLALHFLRAYTRINCYKSSSATASSIRRSKRIKIAAYASMACAAGPKRAWSRALLHKLQHRSRRSVTRAKVFLSKMNKRKVSGVGVAGKAINRAEKLRGLVPGGERMDFCSLLDETADYIKCLTAQVHVMQGIADSLAPQAWF